MNREDYLNMEPYSLSQTDKEELYRDQMSRMSSDHRRACKAYEDICKGLGEDCPYLPVTLFKDVDLKSVPDDKVIRRITSSGTSGQQVSRIYLDSETSAAQQRALCSITGDFIGSRRIPMLIIDSPDVLRDRSKFTARGAGILGFSMMASKRIYALDEQMNLDMASLEEFQKLAVEGPTFAFGFTYMIWQYLYEALRKEGRTIDLGGCHLIHGGGWKKLENIKVSDEEFRKGLSQVCGIDSVSDYYGMAEQTGSIFMQCSCGHLHASIFSDISILDPEDFSECEKGQWGLVALSSLLPESYPGHRLLTEDRGRILGEDDCPCGRKGRYFEISGRISKAEVRGCSDTFEGRASGAEGAKAVSGSDSLITVKAGTYPPEKHTSETFDSEAVEMLQELSVLFTKDPAYRQYPDIYALGFWCRKAHIEKMRRAGGRSGRGLTLHIAPSNMPTMFAYSWITSLLAGNPNIVRISSRTSEITEMTLQGISSVLERPEFRKLKQRNAFLQFERNEKLLKELSAEAKARIIWGGDETVQYISSIPASADCVDITFPDKYSAALLKISDLKGLEDREIRHLAHLFYNDTYGADQNACSSPKTVFWLHDEEDDGRTKERWWKALADEAGNYDLQAFKATEKYRILCRMYAEGRAIGPVRRWGNRLYVADASECKGSITDLEAKFGFFYEMDIKEISEMMPYMEARVQTLVTSGSDQEDIYEAVRRSGAVGVDRVTAIGEALDFNIVWDRKDIVEILSCTFLNETANSVTE